jgi:hypothetical protein
VRADRALRLAPAEAWNTASCGPGSKGDRTYAWAWIATASPRHHLLVRRNRNDPTDKAYFWCYLPEGRPATLSTIIGIAGRRWPVEEDFQQGKEHFGLDHSQVRLYTALTRHLAMVQAMAALATHPVTAARCARPPPPCRQHRPAPTTDHRPTPASSHSPSPRSNACTTCSPAPCTTPPTTCAGPGGDAATKPAPAGTTNAYDSAAKPKQHDQVTKCGRRTGMVLFDEAELPAPPTQPGMARETTDHAIVVAVANGGSAAEGCRQSSIRAPPDPPAPDPFANCGVSSPPGRGEDRSRTTVRTLRP